MTLTEQPAVTAIATELRFGVLGPLFVEQGGRPIDAGGLKQRAVLILLLVNANRTLSVERMIDELWGEDPPATALATLQAYISNLRKLLEPDRPARAPASVLVSRAGSYELVVDGDAVDAIRFERLALAGAAHLADDAAGARSKLVEALGLWRGPALVEFGGYEFANAEALRLDELRITAMENRVSTDLALGRSAELIAELEQLVAEHPLRERLWGQLMRAYYRAGRQAEGLRAYRRCEQHLADELGIVPSTELRSLELAILDQDPSLGVDPVPANTELHHLTVTGMIDSSADVIRSALELRAPEIVGRGHELQLFQEAVLRAQQGRGTVMLVEGEAGIGKTRLLEAMHQSARDHGCRSALARCLEVGGSPPFWPWIQLVRALDPDAVTGAAGPYSPYLSPLYPESTPAGAEDGSPRLRCFRVADGLIEAMRGLATGMPLVVLVDDLHSADPDSLSVLALVGAALATEPVVLVGSYRTGRHPNGDTLVDVLVQLSRFDWCRRLHLAGFDRSQVGELVRRIVGIDVDAGAVDAIHERTDGNAFFTVELARLLVSEDQRHTGEFESSIPHTVKEVVSRRLASLPPKALTMVRVAALAGRTFDIAVVAEAAEASVQSALDLADAAVAEGIVVETEPPGHYRFTHVLMVETIVSGLGSLRRAQLHDRIATILEERFGHESERWHDIAHHRVQAVPVAGVEPAIEALARAGRRATEVNALELADQLLTQRHAFVMRLPPSPARDRYELESLLDQSVVWTWRDGYQSEEMRQAADRMFELTEAASPDAILDPSTETGTRHGVLQALQARCSFEIVAGNVRASTDIAQMMLALAETCRHPYVAAVANINATVTAIQRGDIDDALRHAARVDELLETFDPGLSGKITLALGQQSLAVTHFGFSGWALWMSGEHDRAREALQQGRIVADRSQHAFTRAFHAQIECIVATAERSPDWVEDVLSWHGSDPEAERFSFLDATLDLYRTWAAGMMGDPTAAVSLRNAVSDLDALGARVVQTLHWAMVAELELLAGRPEAALGAAMAGITRSESSGERFWYPELERLAATALEQLGDLPARDRANSRAEAAATAMGVTWPLPRSGLMAPD